MDSWIYEESLNTLKQAEIFPSKMIEKNRENISPTAIRLDKLILDMEREQWPSMKIRKRIWADIPWSYPIELTEYRKKYLRPILEDLLVVTPECNRGDISRKMIKLFESHKDEPYTLIITFWEEKVDDIEIKEKEDPPEWTNLA